MTWKSLFISLLCLGCQTAFAETDQRYEIHRLQSALAREQTAIVTLEQKRRQQNEKLQTLRQALAAQIAQAVKLSHQPASARLLEYHGYLGRSRVALIKDIRKAQAANDTLIHERTLHQAALKKLLLREMQRTPPLPGTLIQTPVGTPIHAVAPGKVIFADALRGFGLMVIISHSNGYMTLYGRNHTLYAKTGDDVRTGQLVALAGNSRGYNSPGRYFELRHNGTPLPLNQNTFILMQSARPTRY